MATVKKSTTKATARARREAEILAVYRKRGAIAPIAINAGPTDALRKRIANANASTAQLRPLLAQFSDASVKVDSIGRIMITGLTDDDADRIARALRRDGAEVAS